ncbi:MAG: SAM-dependent methyltransferase [Acidimicrobiia bacterium]|jgi:tRNA-Thr(GGU) m(6)t(6)A37 methyltransferase TsaA
MPAPPFSVNPIGRVVVDRNGHSLEIDEAYRPALTELGGFSHVNVLWWCHHLDEPAFREMTIAEKPYKEGPEQVGIFATRSPARPNPIALTATPIISLDADSGVVQIAFIDADDGTPILDLKPYLPCADRIRDAHSPQWCADWPQWYEDSGSFDWGSVFENAQ